MQTETKVHFQDKTPPKPKAEADLLCENCDVKISQRDFNKDGLCQDCRRELGIR
jgi:hypothetical protein